MEKSASYKNLRKQINATGSEKLSGYNAELLDEIHGEEREEIRKVLNENINGGIESYKDFHIGEFIEKPNQCGCFRRGGKWYIYQIDEKNIVHFADRLVQGG